MEFKDQTFGLQAGRKSPVTIAELSRQANLDRSHACRAVHDDLHTRRALVLPIL